MIRRRTRCYSIDIDAPDGPRLLAAGHIRAGARADVPERLGTLRVELDALLPRLKPRVVVVGLVSWATSRAGGAGAM